MTENIVLSAISALISIPLGGALEYPVSRLKFILQAQNANVRLTEEARYKGVVDYFRRVPQQEGKSAFWRGFVPSIIQKFIGRTVAFPLKDTFKRILNPYNPKTEFWKFFLGSLCAGAAAGAFASIFTYPLEMAKTKLALDIGRSPEQIQNLIREKKITEVEAEKQTVRQYSGIKDCWRQTRQTDGWRGLYKGFSLSVLGIVLFRGLYFGLYDIGKGVLFENPTILNKFLVAQAVTLLSQALCYPLDTVRRRLMMQPGNENQLYRGAIDCIKHTSKTEGLRGFYGGFAVTTVWSLGSTVALVFYDELKAQTKKV